MNRSSEEKEGGVEADCGEQRRLMSPLEACASGMTEVRCFTGLIMSEHFEGPCMYMVT